MMDIIHIDTGTRVITRVGSVGTDSFSIGPMRIHPSMDRDALVSGRFVVSVTGKIEVESSSSASDGELRSIDVTNRMNRRV